MEDETYTNHDGTFVAVMDGHGGSAVSRYLRQNLYARYLQARERAVSSFVSSSSREEDLHNHHPHTSVQICEQALRDAFSTVDAEVQRVSHWSYQGSTAVAVMIHETLQPTSTARSGSRSGSGSGTTAVTVTPTPDETTTVTKKKTYLITANVGDSRAVLARNRLAIPLTTDHRPDHPEERNRVEALGGSVEWYRLIQLINKFK
jgi:serine/threonine protein phosphatase PrpC